MTDAVVISDRKLNFYFVVVFSKENLKFRVCEMSVCHLPVVSAGLHLVCCVILSQ